MAEELTEKEKEKEKRENENVRHMTSRLPWLTARR